MDECTMLKMCVWVAELKEKAWIFEVNVWNVYCFVFSSFLLIIVVIETVKWLKYVWENKDSGNVNACLHGRYCYWSLVYGLNLH